MSKSLQNVALNSPPNRPTFIKFWKPKISLPPMTSTIHCMLWHLKNGASTTLTDNDFSI